MKTGMIMQAIARIRDKANQFLLAELAGHGIKDLSPSHGDIMGALYLHGELSMKQIAGMIGRDKSTVTSLVNRLIRSGYVIKHTDPGDSRVSLVSLTDKGRVLEEDFWDISQALRQKAYKGLTNEEKETLMTLLAKISGNF